MYKNKDGALIGQIQRLKFSVYVNFNRRPKIVTARRVLLRNSPGQSGLGSESFITVKIFLKYLKYFIKN